MSQVYVFAKSLEHLVKRNDPDLDPQVAGEEIAKIRRKKGGELKKKDVWMAHRRKTAPLHNYFEWDDRVCGVEHRNNQASLLLRAVKVEYVDHEGKTRYIRDSSAVRDYEKKGERVVVETRAALDAEGRRDEILNSCLGGLVAWRTKWSDLCTCVEALEHIELAISALRDSTADAAMEDDDYEE